MSDVRAPSADQTTSGDLVRARAEVKVLVITGLGLNCEVETAQAFRMVGATVESIHLLDLLDGRQKHRFSAYHIISFVGGFAYGDHLGAGFVFANKIRWRLYDPLVEFIERGGLALGICNGFQMMIRLGMLPGLDGDYRTPVATIAPNDRIGYWDTWVRLKVDPDSPCAWTRGIEELELPTRHGEGKFLAADGSVLERLEEGHQIAVRYVDRDGDPTEEWPANPNGSPAGVAGICDPSGRLFGLMPHPDAYLYPFQHPQWSRQRFVGRIASEGGGLAVFRCGVDAAVLRV